MRISTRKIEYRLITRFQKKVYVTSKQYIGSYAEMHSIGINNFLTGTSVGYSRQLGIVLAALKDEV